MARLTAAGLLVALGTIAAYATVGSAGADPPQGSGQVILYRTITATRTVHARVEGHTVRWWRARAVHNRRVLNATRITLTGIRQRTQIRWAPNVTYAIRLASRVFGVDEATMWRVARCESTLRPWASNGRYRGLFQLGWSPFGFSPYDPIANALSAAQTVARDGSWRQWSCK